MPESSTTTDSGYHENGAVGALQNLDHAFKTAA